MGWLGACLLICILLEKAISSAIDLPHARAKRQMRLTDGNPELFPITKVGNTYQIKYFLDKDVAGGSMERGWNRMMKLFEEKTCLSFLRVQQEGDDIATITKTEPAWVLDKKPDQCYVAGGRLIYLGGGCGGEESIGAILHEFMHLLGFLHTQQRKDRDQYLDVKVKRGEIPDHSQIRETATDFPFDYGSVVSYPETIHCDEKSCYNITVKDERYSGAMNIQMTMQYFDYYMANHYYKCLENCDQKNHKCQNSGYPKPTDCSKCVCPPGLGGQFCTERETSCGATYTAGTEWQMIKKLEKTGLNPNVQDERCFHLITAPPGKWIEYDITTFSPQPHFHLYFYGHEDLRMSPYGFNKGLQTPESLKRLKHGVYKGNALRFRTNASWGKAYSTTVMYRYVDKYTSATSTETPTVEDTATQTPYVHTGDETWMIGYKTCVAAGETPPTALFDREIVRAQLERLTNTTHPKFMITLFREQKSPECQGKELYDYQLVYDITSDEGLTKILRALYTGFMFYFEDLSFSWSRLTAAEMQQLFDLNKNHRTRDKIDSATYESQAAPFPLLRQILEEWSGYTVIADEAQ